MIFRNMEKKRKGKTQVSELFVVFLHVNSAMPNSICKVRLTNVKRLKYIINWTIWSLLALYVGVLVAVHVPFVQRLLGEKVADAVAEKIGSKAHVGNVNLGFLNRIIIDDVTILDQSDSTMLRAGRMSVKVDFLPLLKGRISISSAQLFGVHANFYKTDSLAAPNYQFVLDALASNDTTSNSPIDLHINSLIIRHSSLRYDRKDAEETIGQLNLNHLNVSDISAHIILKTLNKDSLNVNIKRLALKEHSGLNVERFSMRLTANHQGACLEDFHLQLPHSILRIDNVTASYDADHLQSLRYATALEDVSITPSDVACMVPALKNFDHALSVNATINGTFNSIDCRDLRIRSDNGKVNLSAELAAQHLDSIPDWQATVHTLDLTDGITAELKEAFDEIPTEAVRLGSLHLSGTAYGHGKTNIDSRCTLATDAGHVNLTFALNDGQLFKGHLQTDSISLGRILDNEELGLLSTHVNISGDAQRINAKGIISRLDYKGYPYHDIQLDGIYQKDNMEGMLSVDDPNMQIELKGSVHRSRRTTFKLTGHVNYIAPKALHLTNQWDDADFAGTFDADFTASSLNDAEGTFALTDFTMTQNDSLDTRYHIDNLYVESGYQNGQHFMKINGDMGRAELSGDFDWATLPQSFVNYTASKLPTLPGLPQKLRHTNNNFTASLKLNSTQWMNHLLHIPMVLDQPVSLDIRMNDDQHLLDIDGQMPAFTYNDSQYRNGSITLTTDNNTTHCNAMLTKIMDNNAPLELQLVMQASDNQLATSFLWDNKGSSGKDINGIINTVTEVYTNEQGKPEARIHIEPSQVILDSTPWHLAPSDIIYSDRHLVVDYFNVSHGNQHLIIDGVASTQPTDTLMVDMNELEVAYILDLVNFHSVSFEGLATGRAYLTHAFGNASAWTNLTVDEFRFQQGRMGTLHAMAKWNNEEEQIDIHAICADDDEAQTAINGYISPVHKDIDLRIEAKNTNIEFCNSFTRAFLRDVKGTANGQVELAGLLSRIYLTGKLVIDGQATVTALNTTYWLQSDTVNLLPDQLRFQACSIADREGHQGLLDGTLNHRSFKNFTYDISVDADHLLAYDFPTFDDEIICGIVFATGHASIHGKPGEVIINCDVTPNRDSFFAYNAANPDAISQQDFITWGVSASPSFKDSQVPPSTPTEIPDMGADIYLNFNINATPEGTLKVLMDQRTQDYITLNGAGNIKATFYNKGPFNMFGTYTIDHGTYGITIQNIIKKNFTFQEGGTIVFGGDPFHAALNMQALYTVNGVSLSDLNLGNSFSDNTVRVNCLMNIAGTPEAPRVEFDLEMPNVNSEEQQMIRSVIASEQEMNQQVLYLLGIGRFYTQGANNGQSQQYDQTSLAMQSFLSGTVSTQISELLAQVIKSNDWNFGANIATGNEGWHNAEYEGIVSGRMLNNRLLINGQFGYRNNATQANPSFIGDFDIRYLLNPNGNLALKVYNQTNDRYFTRSSLNTQGVGLIMKRDFNGLGDLFRPIKRKKK